MTPPIKPAGTGLGLVACAIAALALAGPARAAQTPPPPATCTDVQVGSAQSYDCINARLGAAAAAAATQRNNSADAPLSSSSPSNVVGTFNEGATRNRLGQNFGKSAIPYRPAPASPPALPPPR